MSGEFRETVAPGQFRRSLDSIGRLVDWQLSQNNCYHECSVCGHGWSSSANVNVCCMPECDGEVRDLTD